MDIRPTTTAPTNQIWPIWASTVCLSLVVSAYVLLLSWFNQTNVDADPLERAADIAAHDFAAITVSNPALGDIAVSDSSFDLRSGSSNLRVRSFNTTLAVLEQAWRVADQYHLNAMREQVGKDLVTLQEMNTTLHNKLLQELDVHGAIYERVRRLLARNVRSGETLEQLKMSAGYLKVGSQESQTALKPLIVPGLAEPVYLHQQSYRTALTQATDFIPCTGHKEEALPGAILLEATYSSKKSRQKHTRKLCVIVGSLETRLNGQSKRRQPRQASVLTLNFPQGRPPQVNSLAQIFSMRAVGTGQWLQTVDGRVPGPGKLAPPITPSLGDMNAVDALSVTFYHWLRQLEQAPSKARLDELICAQWPAEVQPSKKKALGSSRPEESAELAVQSESPANSCLVSDSDARAYAFLHQNASNEEGQLGLLQCFSSGHANFPLQALPLVVSADGRANLPGRTGFDRKLVSELLLKIYETNLAAQDTLATSKLIESSATKSLHSARDRVLLAQADLVALKDRLHQGLSEKEKTILQEEIAARDENVALEMREQKRLTITIALARTARANALSAANQSFDLSSRLFQASRSGIYRMAGDGKMPASEANTQTQCAFLLGKHFAFFPLTQALNDSLLVDKANQLAEQGEQNRDALLESTPWLRKKIIVFAKVKDVFIRPDTKIFAEGKSLSELLAEEPPVRAAAPQTIVLDSRSLNSSKKIAPISLSESPFDALPISEKQLVYYNPKALTSGQSGAEAAVSWSCLARDLVAYREKDNRYWFGEPLQSLTQGWCKRGDKASDNASNATDEDSYEETCPGMAGEWQLRRPLVLIDSELQNTLKGTTLTNPQTGQRMPQVPPAGPPLM